MDSDFDSTATEEDSNHAPSNYAPSNQAPLREEKEEDADMLEENEGDVFAKLFNILISHTDTTGRLMYSAYMRLPSKRYYNSLLSSTKVFPIVKGILVTLLSAFNISSIAI